jgi:DNA polymerase-3 subunit alpha
VEPWTLSARLNCEKEVLGFYLSDHPLNGIQSILLRVTSCEIVDLVKFENKKKVIIGGVIASFREMFTRKGTRMCFAQLEDLSGMVEMVVFPDTYAQAEMMLKSDQPLVVEGILEKEEESVKIIVEKIHNVTDRMKNLNRLKISLTQKFDDFESLKRIIKKYPGQSEVYFECQLDDLAKKVTLKAKNIEGVNPSPQFFEELYSHFKDRDWVRLDA